jgi:hypothetical protein
VFWMVGDHWILVNTLTNSMGVEAKKMRSCWVTYSSAEGTDCFKSRKGAAKVGQMIQHDKSTCCKVFLYSSSWLVVHCLCSVSLFSQIAVVHRQCSLLGFSLLSGVHDDKHMWGLPSHKMTWRWSSFLLMALSSIVLHVICPQHGFLLLTQEILLG